MLPRAMTLWSYLGKGLTGVLQAPGWRFPSLPHYLPSLLLALPILLQRATCGYRGFIPYSVLQGSKRMSFPTPCLGFFYPNTVPSETCWTHRSVSPQPISLFASPLQSGVSRAAALHSEGWRTEGGVERAMNQNHSEGYILSARAF